MVLAPYMWPRDQMSSPEFLRVLTSFRFTVIGCGRPFHSAASTLASISNHVVDRSRFEHNPKPIRTHCAGTCVADHPENQGARPEPRRARRTRTKGAANEDEEADV